MSNNSENKEPLNKSFREPKLRFPEFNDNYLEYNFGDVFSIFNGLNKEKEAFGFGNPIVNYMDVNKNEFLLSSMIKGQVNTDEQEICRYSITTSDILIARTSETINEIAYSSCLLENISNCTYSGFLLKASPKIKNIVFSPYIVLLLRSPIYRKKLMKLSTETSRALINSDNLAKLIFYIPDLKEQKKTWLLFNQLLKKITITEQKINILKKYKEGLAKFAIKESIILWKYKVGNENKLKDFLIEENELIENNGTLPHLTLSKDGISDKTERYDRNFLVKDDNKKYKITYLNQLCYNPANLKFGVICVNNYGDGIFSPIYVTFKVNNVLIPYIELILTSRDFIKYSLKFQQGTVYERMAVSPEDFLNIGIVITDKKRQLIMSETIIFLESKITKLKDQLSNLYKAKQFLIYKMFI